MPTSYCVATIYEVGKLLGLLEYSAGQRHWKRAEEYLDRLENAINSLEYSCGISMPEVRAAMNNLANAVRFREVDIYRYTAPLEDLLDSFLRDFSQFEIYNDLAEKFAEEVYERIRDRPSVRDAKAAVVEKCSRERNVGDIIRCVEAEWKMRQAVEMEARDIIREVSEKMTGSEREWRDALRLVRI